jgi:hypothetical protein
MPEIDSYRVLTHTRGRVIFPPIPLAEFGILLKYWSRRNKGAIVDQRLTAHYKGYAVAWSPKDADAWVAELGIKPEPVQTTPGPEGSPT